MALTFMLQQTVLKGETTAAGASFYQGGRLEENNRVVGSFTIITDTFTGVTDLGNMDTGMVRFQLFIEAHAHGPHGGSGAGGGGGGNRPQQVPETLVLEGACDFVGQAPTLPGQPGQPVQGRQIARAAGSVSAATQQLATHIDKQWILVGNQLTVG